jgi:CheY-like chemotaxis protein
MIPEIDFVCGELTARAKREDVVTDLLQGKGEHLLIVEDDGALRELLARMLRIFGYSVAAVASGEEAVDYLEQNQAHLVLLDMLMSPGINGRETYERILAFRPGQRAIVVSGFTDADEIKRIRELGVSQIVKKPFTLQDLGSAVKRGLLG